MAAPLSMVTLKDGSQVPQSTLETITGNLNYLGGKHFMALIELVEKCRDKNPFDPNSFNDSKKLYKVLDF